MLPPDLSSQVALVTGGAHRLGKVLALALAGAGANVAIHYHSSGQAASETLQEIRNLGVDAVAIQGDLSRSEDAERVVAATAEHFGRLDILVNSAAIMEQTLLGKITPEAWRRIMGINLKGPLFCAQAAAKIMLAQSSGNIVQIADSSGFPGQERYLLHFLSKEGVKALTRLLAQALAPDVRVNAIAPGPVLVPTTMSAKRREEIAKSMPLGHFGRPENVADALLFVLADDYMTGEVIVVDGGMRL